MSKIEELNKLLKKDEYAEVEKNKQLLAESATEYFAGVKDRFEAKQAPLRRIRNKCEFAKEIICECMCNLYESALIIDDINKYSKSLRKVMREQCVSVMEDAKDIKDLEKLFENSSPYIKGMISLAETAYENKTDEQIKEFDNKILLDKEDLDLVNKFESDEGKDVYATDLQDRVIDVYKNEEKLGEEQKNRVQTIVDELNKINLSKKEEPNKAVTESIEKGVSMFNTTPKSIFNAIFVNKSKSLMAETAGNLEEIGEQIIAETIATYTLLETIHSLGFKTYSDEEKQKLKMDFFIS